MLAVDYAIRRMHFRFIRNFTVYLRRATLRLILFVPPNMRAKLSSSLVLTRCFEFFDRAKYEPILDAGTAAEAKSLFRSGVSLAGYSYQNPVYPESVASALHENFGLPLISVIMPVFNSRVDWLIKAVESVTGQWYPNWELCIVDDCSDSPETISALQSLSDDRIRLERLDANQGIVGASNAALAMASGEFVALLDHDDELTTDALWEVYSVIQSQKADFIYSDEDKIDQKGRYCEPHFKPDFSPDTLLSQNYISHLGVIRRSLIEKAGGFSSGKDGAQDHDLYLRIVELTDKVFHIPRVLYHWRKVPGSTASVFTEKSYAQTAGIRAVESALARRDFSAVVTSGSQPGTYKVNRRVVGNPLVSILIPFKDKPELLNLCIGSILKHGSYENFEIIGVSNNSVESATKKAMEQWAAADSRISFVPYNVPFNFSEINNFAVREHAQGTHILLLNNDIEFYCDGWLESLLQHSQRSDVGAIGGRLYYPDGRLQHAGIILGIGGVAGHSHKYFDQRDPGYFARPHITQNVSAVTGACMMVKKNLYEEIGGFDEVNLGVAFNDVDFCLRLREQGFLNIYTPYCEARHHESISRGQEDTEDKKERFRQEVLYMMKRHEKALKAGDPYYNPNLTLEHENFMLSSAVLDP